MGVDEQRLRKRRIRMNTAQGRPFRIAHPIDCLASRMENLVRLPDKRSGLSIAQSQSAIRICAAFGERLLRDGKEREAIRLSNDLFDLVLTHSGKRILAAWGLDILEGIPEPDRFTTAAFREEIYPRRRQEVQARRERFMVAIRRREESDETTDSSDPDPPG